MTEEQDRSGRISLREYIEARLDAHDLLHEQHTQAHDREHKASEMAIAKSESASQTALARAQETIDARFESTNEWRGAFSDRERSFLTKVEYQSAHNALLARIDKLEDAEIARVTREAERERSQIRLMALVGLGATLISVALSVLIRLGIGA